MAKRTTSRSAQRTKKTSAPGAAKTNTKKPIATQPGAGDSQEQPGEQLVPVVGVGASAGGVEAFTQLLEALPVDTGMAFVLISHLSHTHKSVLAEILSKATRMPVTETRRRTPVEANHVYVMPPNVELTLENGVILAKPSTKPCGLHLPIDHFLRSLAERRKSRAVGVILSGTGTDGSLGFAAIRAEGGITFAQDETSAQYADMARSASAAIGSADFVLPPKGIARELTRIARHPYVAQPKPAAVSAFTEAADELRQIFRAVRAETGIDFSHYKPTTIHRRISRRMLLHKIETLPDYLGLLQSNPEEVQSLSRDLLISVTGFFRDPEAFEYLEGEVIPAVIKQRVGNNPIRVWVPGCATGEEAYSIAICLLEALGDYGTPPPLQIFATDVSEDAIRKAREAMYPENIVQDVSAERLKRFFVRTESGYQIVKPVRDLCVFAVQNVIKDPPFSRVDLISCRNLLIYLETALQQRVLAVFHYALKPSGYLLLGSSETVGSSGLFRQISKKHKLYAKLHSAVRPEFDLRPTGSAWRDLRHKKKPGAQFQEPLDVGREIDSIILQKYGASGLVVNAAMDIVEYRGDSSAFLAPSPGRASLNLFKMTRQGLAVDLRAAIHQAKKTGSRVRKEGLPLGSGGAAKTVSLEVIPLKRSLSPEDHYLVLFEDMTEKQETKREKGIRQTSRRAKGKTADEEQEIAPLKAELASVQQELSSIIEEQEITNEKLQAANEEILSSNEELQSTNEELETAKEEMQATNEELTTVNDELRNRNAELTQANNDLNNLIGSVDIVYLLLGNDLRIRRFTPGARKALNLIPGDIGKSIGDIRPNIDLPNLGQRIAEVIDTRTAMKQEVQDLEGHWYCMKIRPYITEDDRIDGAILALVDIDALKQSQQELRESEAGLRSLLKEVPDFILAAGPEGKIRFMNRTAANLAKEAVIGESIYKYLEPQDQARIRKCLEAVRTSGRAAAFETQTSGPPRAAKQFITRVGPVKSEGKVVGLTLTTEEAAASKQNRK